MSHKQGGLLPVLPPAPPTSGGLGQLQQQISNKPKQPTRFNAAGSRSVSNSSASNSMPPAVNVSIPGGNTQLGASSISSFTATPVQAPLHQQHQNMFQQQQLQQQQQQQKRSATPNTNGSSSSASPRGGMSSSDLLTDFQRQVNELLLQDQHARNGIAAAEQGVREHISERFDDAKQIILRFEPQLKALQEQQQQAASSSASLLNSSESQLLLRQNSSAVVFKTQRGAGGTQFALPTQNSGPTQQQQHLHHHHHQAPAPLQPVSIVPHRVVMTELQELLRTSTRNKTSFGGEQQPLQQQVADASILHKDSERTVGTALVEHRAEEFCSVFVSITGMSEPAAILRALQHAASLLNGSQPAVAQELLAAGRFSRLKRDMDKVQASVRRAREEASSSSSSSSSAAVSSSASSGTQLQQQHHQLQALGVSCARAPLLPASVILAIIREQEAMDERAASSSSAPFHSYNYSHCGNEDGAVFPIATAAATLLDAFGRAYQQCILLLASEKLELAAAAASTTISVSAADAASSNNDAAQAMMVSVRQAHARSVAWLLGWGGAATAAACNLARRSMDEYKTVRPFETSLMISDALRVLARFPSRCSDPAACWPLLILIHAVVRNIEALGTVVSHCGVPSLMLDAKHVSTIFATIAVPLGACRAHARTRIVSPSYVAVPCTAINDDFEDVSIVTLLLYTIVTARVLVRVQGSPAAGCTIASDWAHVQSTLDATPLLLVRERVCRLLEIQETDFFAALNPGK